MSRRRRADPLDQSAHWDERTRKLIHGRLGPPPALRFFTPREGSTLRALVDVLLPQDDVPLEDRVHLSERIDSLLAAGETDGYRTADVPWDEELLSRGLAALDDTARLQADVAFADLTSSVRHEMVTALLSDHRRDGPWEAVAPETFLARVLHYAVSVYYADPRAWAEIGWPGPASPRGYVRLAYGQGDRWEPDPPGGGPRQ